MAMKFTSLKCPDCGANLRIEEGRTQIYCSYCGSNIIITNENEYIYRHIDEAEVKQAETDRMVQLKKMEIEEKRRAANEKNKAFKIKLSIILGVIAILTLGIGFTIDGAFGISIVGEIACIILMLLWLGNKDEEDIDDGNKAKVPFSIDEYEKKSYTVIEAMFISAGFTNVKCVPLNDLTVGVLKKPGMVDSIVINGQQVESGGRKFPCDANVVISYHSFSNK